MEVIKIKSGDSEILLNIHDDSEIDIERNNLEDTLDLSKVVKQNETE